MLHGFFKSSRLGFCFSHVFAKAGDGVGERNFGFSQRRHSVMRLFWITRI